MTQDFKAAGAVELDQLAHSVREWQQSGQRIALCHGCFDLLHLGHVRHFNAARSLADRLVVTVTADVFVGEAKGSGRPVFSEHERAEIIAAIEAVDAVAISPWKTAIEVLNLLRPDVFVKGQDYAHPATHVGAIAQEIDVVRSYGGTFRATDTEKFSTTELIERIRNDFPEDR